MNTPNTLDRLGDLSPEAASLLLHLLHSKIFTPSQDNWKVVRFSDSESGWGIEWTDSPGELISRGFLVPPTDGVYELTLAGRRYGESLQ